MKQVTTLISALLFLTVLVPSYVLGACKIPQIDKSFMKPFETEKIKWRIHDLKLYDNKKLGANLKFETEDTKVDFYVYDLGKSKITQEDLDQQLRNSVDEIIFSIKKYEPSTKYSLPMLVSEKMISGKENLIQKAVFLIKKGQNTNSVSIVSMGFDGKCFQKLRYSKLVGSDENFEQYFDNPGHNVKVARAIMGFVGFTIIFHEELMNSGYFN